jgi:hypothetical protein
MQFPGFIGPTYQSQSLFADAEECMNWYPELVESGAGRNKFVYYRTPGLATFVTLPKTPVRGVFAGENRLFAVAGTSLYEIFGNATFTDRSALGGAVTIGNDGFPVDMAFNGNQILIASAGLAWVDNGAGTVAANFIGGGQVPAVRVSQLDGYFWAQKGTSAGNTNSRQFFLSNLLDGTTWDPLQYASKESQFDNIAAIFQDHEEMWLFGDEQSTEVWSNNGQVQPQFPFQRNPAAIMNHGCRAPFSVARFGNGIAWLAGDQQRGGVYVVHSEGYRPNRISTHAIETAWTSYSAVSDAVAYTEIRRGHEFYIISFPSANPTTTWAYDLTTRMWHRRGFWSGGLNVASKIRFQCWVGLGGANPYTAWYGGGGGNEGTIYGADNFVLNDAGGVAIHRVRTAPYIADRFFSVIHHRLQVLMQTGAIPLNPQLEWSDDGGANWSNPVTVTVPANSMPPVVWGDSSTAGGLGRSPRGRLYRLTLSDIADMALIDADIEVSPGRY